MTTTKEKAMDIDEMTELSTHIKGNLNGIASELYEIRDFVEKLISNIEKLDADTDDKDYKWFIENNIVQGRSFEHQKENYRIASFKNNKIWCRRLSDDEMIGASVNFFKTNFSTLKFW